jgi:SAM-dependent methyltransferase
VRETIADHKLYGRLADWWPLFSAPADYAEEAHFYANTLASACDVTPRAVLELGSGGGNNASHFRRRFEMVLVEPSEGMLRVSKALNPECEHIRDDMRTVRLDRTFDAVFVHDAVNYLTSERDLRAAMQTAFVHCRPGGAALFAPDFVQENFRVSTDCGGQDEATRSLRYLEWTWDPDPSDNSYTVDYVIALRCERGEIELVHDRHVQGLYTRERWLALLREVGFEPETLPLVHTDVEPGSHEVFVARKKGAAK